MSTGSTPALAMSAATLYGAPKGEG